MVNAAPITEDQTTLERILAELKVLNLRQQEEVIQLKAMDWKLWVMMNSIVDSLLKTGAIEEDPRTK
jgi:hypothetical protein